MKKITACFYIVSVLMFGIGASCKKKSTPAPPGGGEANLVVTLNPPVNSSQAASPQTDFPLTVTINSTMPSGGVTINVSAKKDDGSGAAAFFTTSSNTSSSISNFTITNTPVSVVCLTTVTVTSRSLASNTWTGTYRYSRKP